MKHVNNVEMPRMQNTWHAKIYIKYSRQSTRHNIQRMEQISNQRPVR